MRGRALDPKILGNLAGRLDFWPDPCVSWTQGAVAQSGPVFAHLGVKRVTARWLHKQIVWRVDPLHIRAERDLPTQINRQVNS